MRYIYLKRSMLALAVLFVGLTASAQYQQNFDTITTTGTGAYNNLPEGWGIYEVGTGTAADGKYAVNNGSSNAGNAYSYGATGSTDRALGSLGSGGNSPTIGAIFFNETDQVIPDITINFTMEQWRFGGTNTTTRPAGTADVIPFTYSLDATSIANTATGTYVAVPQLNMVSKITSGTAGALDGNAAANRQVISYTITGINLAPGASFLIRWSDSDSPGNDDGLGIDDFSITAGMEPGVLVSGATNTGGGTGSGGGTQTPGTSTSVPIFDNKVSIDSGFVHLYGNLHGHSTHSDGRPSTGTPTDDYNFARQALNMDFLGISEHNHSTAGLQIANYHLGYQEAEAANGQLNLAGNPFIAMYGMEWGTISGGGHVLVYGFKDSLINWETGNYDILVNKSDYLTLFDTVRKHNGAVALLAHPNTSDFTNLTGGYKGVADSAVVGVAVESGPAFSTSTTYNDFPASLAYITYFRTLLKQGYRLAPGMDQDNHELTYGTANANRLVVLAKDRTREGIMNALRAMRFYASNDYNTQVNMTMNNYIMGSSLVDPNNQILTVNYTDADGESLSAVQIYGGRVGGADATVLQTSSTSTTTYTTVQPQGETWYYYAVLTQTDGNKMVTAPIWLTRPAAAPLPVKLEELTASLVNEQSVIRWHTGTEIDAKYFDVERSADGKNYKSIGKVAATGTGSSYQLIDPSPATGVNYYRLRMVDQDLTFEYSNVVTVTVKQYGYTVYPNPAVNILKIKGGRTGEKVDIRLIDGAGNQVYRQTQTGGDITIDVSKYAAGMYVIRINDELHTLIISK